MRLRFRLAAAMLIVSGALGLLSAARAEPPSDSKNFSTPPAVPNYFSNESGPVTRTPAPLPFAPSTAVGAVREDETPAARPEPTIARPPERRIITIVTSPSRGRVTHARTRRSDRRKVAVARGRNSKPVQVGARARRPQAARLAHAEHSTRSRPAIAKGQRAGRG